MTNRYSASLLLAFAAGTVFGQTQTQQRRATIIPGGRPDVGKCTVEVVVDGAAEVEVRGDSASVRNLSGQPPQLRRFECSGAMPAGGAEVRFAGVRGRGKQQLIRDPRDGGSAVVRIEDRDNGADAYTFELAWSLDGQRERADDREFRPDRDGRNRQPFSQDDAVRGCQDAVRQQASRRFDPRSIEFRRIQANDNPGRRDVVAGVFTIRSGDRADEVYRFSCSVDLESGRVWDAQFSPAQDFRGDGRNRPVSPNDRAIRSCQDAVEQHVTRDGYRNPAVESIRADDRPGRNDWVVGRMRADSRDGQRSFDFSCSVDLSDGDVRSVDIQPRR